MSPATGHDIIADIKDLFWFLSTELNTLLPSSCNTDFRIDAESIVVSGSSAGGLCSYLAAIHATPKPKGVLSLYGQGGDFLVRFPLARILFVSFIDVGFGHFLGHSLLNIFPLRLSLSSLAEKSWTLKNLDNFCTHSLQSFSGQQTLP